MATTTAKATVDLFDFVSNETQEDAEPTEDFYFSGRLHGDGGDQGYGEDHDYG